MTTKPEMKRKFFRLLENFRGAAINHDLKGGKPPEEWNDIDAKFFKARDALTDFFDKLIEVRTALIDLSKWPTSPDMQEAAKNALEKTP